MDYIFLKNKLFLAGLKITPQRIAVLEALIELKNHPTAETVMKFVKAKHPEIASGTVYKVLDVLSEKKIIKKVHTDEDFMRFDATTEIHHHLYCSTCDKIEDYMDDELNVLLSNYFSKKKIEGFQIEEFSLQIKGTFQHC